MGVVGLMGGVELPSRRLCGAARFALSFSSLGGMWLDMYDSLLGVHWVWDGFSLIPSFLFSPLLFFPWSLAYKGTLLSRF